MMQRRFPVALVVLIVIVLLVLGGNALRQAAWRDGYMMGRLAAGGEAGAALPYGYPGFPGYSPFSGWGTLLVLLFLGLLAFGVLRHVRHRAWRMAGGPQQGAGEAGAERGSWWHHSMRHWCGAAEQPAEGPPEPGKEEQKEPPA
jgi:hypothetical protein